MSVDHDFATVFPIKALRAKGRLQDAITELQVGARLAGLPPVRWGIDLEYDLTGTASGTDRTIIRDVSAWAKAFGVKAQMMQPRTVQRSGRDVVSPGYVVAHLPVDGLGITIGGRLTEVPGVIR